MLQEVTLPEIADNVESGSVTKVLVSEGDTVAEGDTLLELETDKATVEVPSSADGAVREILVSEGDNVKVGAVIAKIETDEESGSDDEASEENEAGKSGGGDEDAASEENEADAPEDTDDDDPESEPPDANVDDDETDTDDDEAPEPDDKKKPAPKPDKKSSQAKDSADSAIPKSAGGDVPASPSTRRLAREIGVDITEVSGSGPGGRITADDVKGHSRETRGGGKSGASAGASDGMSSAFSLPDFSRWGETRREKLGNIRRITGENTQAAWQTIPHVTQFDEADVTDLEAFRQRFSKLAEKRGVKLTVTSILMKVVARALRQFPRFNASLDAEAGEVIYKDFINISVAADTDRGLLVPVVRDANKKSILTLSEELGDLAERARSKKIKPEEMQGGTFTISNLGGIGGTGFTPVVFAPQVAIMGVSRAQTKPVWRDGEFVPREILPLSVSYDHRVIDGADGARFLRWVCEALEQPLFMDLEGDES